MDDVEDINLKASLNGHIVYLALQVEEKNWCHLFQEQQKDYILRWQVDVMQVITQAQRAILCLYAILTEVISAVTGTGFKFLCLI